MRTEKNISPKEGNEIFLPKSDNGNKYLEVYGARVHNLQNIDISIPRNQLILVTGLSGSGKSSLAFDTIYAEGQRRYMETFSAYARHFIGNMDRPDVDKITGLSPVISIEQKTTNKNPRSTVGTVTEIYDFIRLLYARIADAFSYVTGEKMVRYTEAQISELIFEHYLNKEIYILAPVVKGRKGHYRDLFEQIARKGFLKVRIDGKIQEITFGLQLDRYKVHDIEIVVDRILIKESSLQRISQSIKTAFQHGKGILMVCEAQSEEVRFFSRLLMCPTSGISYNEPEPNTFSFNSPYGACPKCNGLGNITEVDLNKIIPDKKKSIRKGAFEILGAYNEHSWIYKQLSAIGERFGFTLDTPVEDISEEAMNVIFYGSNEILKVKNDFLETGGNITFEGIVNFLSNLANEETPQSIQKWASNFMNETVCPECNGTRLKKESLYFKIDGKNIAEISNLDLYQLNDWFLSLEQKIDERKQVIAHEIIQEIQTRIRFLLDVGIGYLNLNRSSKTLSGGESQRIRLATQIGSKLVNVLYILDEPSIGLHQRDNRRLIKALQDLRDVGNSVIVVEHDKDMIMSADYVLDIGPGAGIHGGKIVASGTPDDFLKQDTITSSYLNGKKQITIPAERRMGNGFFIHLNGATGNNLKNIDLSLPLGMLVCVTGVSGSGKSSLINETLHPILNQHFYRSQKRPLPYQSIDGIEHIDKVIEINQSPIGRTPRSNPATYVGVFDDIRKLFAALPSAKIRGYKPGRFSFNVKGGRCETCSGAGLRTIEMNFLPNVYVPCETCSGKRYNRETLEIRYKGKSISDVLDMNIDEAVVFFENIPSILQKIKTLRDVGLGYITLGQQSTTLSGGEAQRVKLATELSKRDTGNTLYILDEPTTGLHFEDVRILLDVLQKLVDKGNTVLIIEHNMDVIKVADYVIDLGPEGGIGGGRILCEGVPEQIAQSKESYTGEFLKEELGLK